MIRKLTLFLGLLLSLLLDVRDAIAQLAGGTYTINSALATGGTNFQSFTDAVTALNVGITGSIVLNVTPNSGPYNERVSISATIGTNPWETLTIFGNGNTLIYNPSINSTEQYTFGLDGADNISVHDLNIIATNYGSNSCNQQYAVQLWKQADNDSFVNCTFTAPAGYCGYEVPFVLGDLYSVQPGGSNNVLVGCTMNSGDGSVMLFGSDVDTANKIINCNIKNFNNYGIVALNQDSLLISSNIIERPDSINVSNTPYCIYYDGSAQNSVIEKNIIRHPYGAGGTGAVSGIFMMADASLGNESLLVNNLIYGFEGNGTQYGIDLSDADYVKAYHNTVVLDNAASTSGTTVGISSTTGTGNDIKNNIVYITRGGTGTKHCLYYTGGAQVSNYNNLYINAPAGNNNIGYYNTNQVTLANWQAANWDLNSVSLNPLFANPPGGGFAPSNPVLDNLGTYVNVNSDLNDNPRNITTPDIGAVEFTVPPCSSTPTPGIVSASSIYVCFGGSSNLNLSGYTVASGLTFQWESTTNLSGTWIPEGSAQSSPAISVTPAVSGITYYRCTVSCGSNFAYSDTIQVNVPALFPGGIYTINSAQATGGTNFQSFTDAVAAISCGIAGPIVFNVVANNGPYNEQVTLPATIGSTSVNTVTFNGNGNTLTYDPSLTQSAPYTLGVEGADYITVNNLNIVATGGGVYSYAVHLWNQADNDSFVNCALTGTLSSNADNVVFAAGGTVNDVTVSSTIGAGNHTVLSGCSFNGGFYSIAFYGSNSNTDIGNQVLNCSVKNFYLYGVYTKYEDSLVISRNIIERPDSINVNSYYGINIDGTAKNALIEKNILRHPFSAGGSGSAWGIVLQADAILGNENKIYNNLIYSFEGDGTQYGIYLSGSEYVKAYHNTVVLDNAASTAGNTRGIYSTNGVGHDIENNNIYITRGGSGTKYCLYYTGGVQISNYNNLYINAPLGTNSIGYFTGAQATLANWQTINVTNPWDANSISIDPQFANPSVYIPTNVSLDNMGTYVNVNNDLYDSPRSTTTPDIGAIEFAFLPCAGTPTPGIITASTTNICFGDSLNLNLSGFTIATGINFQWESTQNLSGTWTPEGSLQTASPIMVTPANTGITYYRCMVSCINSSNFAYSDTIQVNVPTLFPGGAYTINSAQATGGTNFQTFNDAVAAISCGIAGSIVFNVIANSGPYNEQVTLPATIGSNVFATVTFNGNGNTITYDPALTPSTPYTWGIDGADYITVNNLNIAATGGSFSYAVHLWNQADNDSFVNCVLTGTLTSSGDNVVFAAGGTADDVEASSVSGAGNYNILSGCTFNGGRYSIALYGNSANADTGNQVLNCTIKNFYEYGMLAEYQDNLIFSRNTIERPDSSAVDDFAGITLDGAISNALIEKNIIHHPFGAGGTGSVYGVYMTGDATAGNENKIYNNLIYGFEGDGTQYGMYFSNAQYINVYHNTIVLDNAVSTAGTTIGIYSSTGTGNDIQNNNVYITRAGTGTKYCLYFTSGNQTSNYNNLYMNAPSGTNSIGFFGSDQATLANWQAANATPWDISSISLDPQFVNAAGANYEPSNTAFLNTGTPLATVTDDLFGNPRSTTAPNMGAIECCGVPLFVKLLSINAVNAGTRNRIDWATVSEDAATYYELERSADNKTFAYLSRIISKGKAIDYTYWDEAPFTGINYYRLKIYDKSGAYVYSKTVSAFVNKDNAFMVEAFPNPVTARLSVRIYGNIAKDAQVELWDVTGKLIYNQLVTGQETEINTEPLAKGVYFIRYSDAAHVKTLQITRE